MQVKQYIAVVIIAILVCLVTLKLYFSSVMNTSEMNISLRNQDANTRDLSSLSRHLADTIRQRNNISRILNLKQKKIGQMECEKTAAGKAGTSGTGGWCAKSSTEHGGKHVTDKKIIPALVKLFSGKSVASFGDGPGRYKQLLFDSGKLKGYDAYDGAPFSETTSEGRVGFLDLTLPQYGLPVYDWIMSLEVAEHIPKQYESTFIDNIVRHAKEGVVLSWAVPGQGGFSHVNNRPFEYIAKLMDSLGFDHDPVESVKLQKAASLAWLRRNTNVYRRRNIDDLNMHEYA